MRATKQPCACGRYTISEAARLLGVGPATLRRWLEVGERTVDAGGGPALSFEDLVTALVVKVFRNAGIGLAAIQAASREAARRWRTRHPFCSLQLLDDGHALFSNPQGTGSNGAGLVAASTRAGFVQLAGSLARQLDYDDRGVAVRWWPMGRDRTVVIDPAFRSGSPVVRPGAVPTRALFDAVQVGQSPDEVAAWLDVETAAVRDAVEFESGLPA